MPRTIYVRCEFTIPVEVPDDYDAEFMIEDNGCPGTGLVGAALSDHMEECEESSSCWACALGGTNKIVPSP